MEDRVADPRRLLGAAVNRSKRQAVQFSKGFYRRETEGDSIPPLARLVRSGRGANVRLKLYLTICLRAVRHPHDVFVPPHSWAEMLGLPDPDQNGARRIRSALKWLEGAQLVQVEREPGKNPRAILLSQSGSGEPYRRPKASGEVYSSLPVTFWSNEWILVTEPPAIAILIILLQLQHGRKSDEAPWIRSPWAYALSPDTWTKGTRSLRELGLLNVRRVVIGGDEEMRRYRNLYWLNVHRLEERFTP